MVSQKPPEFDETLLARRPGETIRPERGLASPAAPAWLEELPRITMQPEGAPGAADPPRSDMRLRGSLGEGGMGRVLLAWQRSLEREVAIKTTRPDTPLEARDRLLAEGRLTGSLEHPAIAPVHALGLGRDGEPLLVMKRIDGVSLRELLRDPRHPMLRLLPGGEEDPLQGVLWVLGQVCNAVHFAHSRGVIHRDIKPDNIMVGAFGEVYLLDWGVAARLPADGALHAVAGELCGTPAYMAPEMVSAAAGPIDARTDVYLLGATLHEVLTGEPRHGGEDVRQVLQAALESAPAGYGPAVPAELAALCRRATAAGQSERPESALALRQALDAYLQHRGAEALVASAEERLTELSGLVAAGADRTAIKRTGIECRFAFELALRAWPECPAARQGKARCLGLLCEEALGQRQPAEAAEVLAEMADPPAALRARVAALQVEVAAEQARAAELRHLARELDERVGARARLYVLAVLGVLGMGMRLYVQGLDLPTYREMIGFAVLVLACGSGAALVLRRQVLANRYSRRLVALLLFTFVALLVHRTAGWAQGLPAAITLIDDLFLCAAVLGAAAIGGYPRLAAAALLTLGGALLSAFRPRWLMIAFPCSLLGSVGSYLVLSLWQERRDRRDAERLGD